MVMQHALPAYQACLTKGASTEPTWLIYELVQLFKVRH
ncbi:CitG protein [Vibrio cholerae]|nr:CitG protein [Vibrio cholerae]